MVNEPWPHGEIFGGEDTAKWYGQFAIRHGKWFFSFLDENDEPTEMYGVGDTPREAFERLVFEWTFRNGGVESNNLRRILPGMREYFREDGFMDAQRYYNLASEIKFD